MAGWSGGVFTRARNWAQDKLNSINPQASLFDQEDDNFATGLNNCVTKDGLNKPSATMDWNSQRLTALGDATGATDALNRQTGDLRYGTYVVKTATTSRTSTTVLADDPHLVLALAAGTYSYVVWLYYTATGSTVQGMKVGQAFTGTATTTRYSSYFTNNAVLTQLGAANSYSGNALSGAGILDGGSATDYACISGMITVTVAGNFKLQWAQNASSGSASNLLIGSYMEFRKLA